MSMPTLFILFGSAWNEDDGCIRAHNDLPRRPDVRYTSCVGFRVARSEQ